MHWHLKTLGWDCACVSNPDQMTSCTPRLCVGLQKREEKCWFFFYYRQIPVFLLVSVCLCVCMYCMCVCTWFSVDVKIILFLKWLFPSHLGTIWVFWLTWSWASIYLVYIKSKWLVTELYIQPCYIKLDIIVGQRKYKLYINNNIIKCIVALIKNILKLICPLQPQWRT